MIRISARFGVARRVSGGMERPRSSVLSLRSRAGLQVALAFGAFSLARAQTVDEFPLYPAEASNAPQSIEEVVYRHNNYDDRGFNRVVQKISVPTLTVYRPAKSAHRGAAMIVCPSGAWLNRLR